MIRYREVKACPTPPQKFPPHWAGEWGESDGLGFFCKLVLTKGPELLFIWIPPGKYGGAKEVLQRQGFWIAQYECNSEFTIQNQGQTINYLRSSVDQGFRIPAQQEITVAELFLTHLKTGGYQEPKEFPEKTDLLSIAMIYLNRFSKDPAEHFVVING